MGRYKKVQSNLLVPFILILLSVPLGSLAAGDSLRSGPAVSKLHTSLLSNMRASVGYQRRYAELKPTINQVFDSFAIARVSLGATWRKLSIDEQNEFVGIVMNTIAATYADRFVDYAGQKFDVVSELENRPGRWVVKTVLTKSGGGTVTLDYYIKDGRIFNVIVIGVSDLSLRRADYVAVIKHQGYLFLLASLKAKLAALGN
jgi:phospholipid transport system substrate-binding protein